MEPDHHPRRLPDMDASLVAAPGAVARDPASPDAVLSVTGLGDAQPVDLVCMVSFDDFYRERRDAIGRALAVALGDADLASDAIDEAMTRAYERWSLVSRLERPEAWVYRVGFNWAMSFLRRWRRSPHPRLYSRPATDDPSVADPSVNEALGALDAKHRSVVVCRHLLGWSVAETATALGVREGTVKSRLHRAHRVLRARLGHLRDLEEDR
jgi:RNA polymerase sigma factor (sigma-70 family)